MLFFWLSQENYLFKKLIRATVTVSSFTLLSRVLGFIRDVAIAGLFGATASADAFLVAFKIPNFMRRLFAEGAFSQAFVPVLSEYKTQRPPAEVKNLLDHVAGNLGGILVIITIIGVAAAPLLILLFAPGFFSIPEKFDLSVEMLRITFPYLLFISLTAFAGAILNTYGRFAIPALTPVILNLCLISAAVWLTPLFSRPILALAWAVLLAGLLQFLLQIPFLRHLHLMPRPRLQRPQHEGVARILRLMLPALFGVSVTQISLLIDTLMASFLVTGSVSWLYYSDRLLEFPIGVFGIALATVILPGLSKTVSQGSFETYSKTLDWSLRWVFLLGVPSMAGLIVLAAPILATLFYRGEFGAHDVRMSAYSLMAYALGLISFILIKVLASGFYARQNTRTPVRIGVFAMFANIALNLLFIRWWAHAGLALATACAATLNATLLYLTLRKDKVFQPGENWMKFLLRIVIAGLCMSTILWTGTSELSVWLAMSAWERAIHLSAWIVAGMIVYFACLWLLGFRPRHMRI